MGLSSTDGGPKMRVTLGSYLGFALTGAAFAALIFYAL